MSGVLLFLNKYLLCVNLLSYGLFWLEGRRRDQNKGLLPPAVHLIASFLGGFLGTWMGMVTARTRKGDRRFAVLVAVAAAVWVAALGVMIAFTK